MKFDIVPYKIDETTVIVGVVIYRGSNTYGRFVKRVEELQKQLELGLKEIDNLKEKIDKIHLTLDEEIGRAELVLDSFDEDTDAHKMFKTRLNILKEIQDEILGVNPQ